MRSPVSNFIFTMSTNGAPAAATQPYSAVTNIGVLPNKIALITGASSGLGRAIAQAYAAAGAYVVSGDITPKPPVTPIFAETIKARGDNLDILTPTVDLLNKNYPSADGAPRSIYVHCDVLKPESVEAAVAAAVAQYGRLDIMVNNAGKCIPMLQRSAKSTLLNPLACHDPTPSHTYLR